MTRLGVVFLPTLLLVGAVSCSGTVSGDVLTSLSDGTTVCVPANAAGEAVIGEEVLQNNSAQQVSVGWFEPSKASNVSVIGATFVGAEEEGRVGALNDPALIPRTFSLDPVPGGEWVSLTVGLRLTNPEVKGEFVGGRLWSGSEAGRGTLVGTSVMTYWIVPYGTACYMAEAD